MRYFAKTPNKSYSGNTIHSNTITLTLGIKKRKKKRCHPQKMFRVVTTSTLSLHVSFSVAIMQKCLATLFFFNHTPCLIKKRINTMKGISVVLSDLKIRTSIGKKFTYV
ncbi:hypothetical protein PYW07_010759 [Mythimna separata]|uniref:Uncharacterized protein n=1 Tax=Mythimna separata TaxID=271217 RepID=A0AAD7Y854_MYTSE|nr:hypothetical protein PYW07_010759 [Mythimna separata]